MAQITALHVYPVKSCRGIALSRARLTPAGLEWDRRWMLVDERGRFVSQRSHPLLATVTTAIEGRLLRLAAPGRAPFELPVDACGDVVEVRIWDDDCLGIDAGAAAARWFSAVAGGALRLVRFDDARPRHANPAWAGPEPAPVGFADGYPLLLTSTASLDALNARLPAPVPMDRFRPNVVIDGVAAHAEDAAASFCSGSVLLRAAKPCTRCVTTTTDQQDGSRDPGQQPLATLRGYRWDPALRGVTFGVNCTVAAGAGDWLAVGDRVDLALRQPPTAVPAPE